MFQHGDTLVPTPITIKEKLRIARPGPDATREAVRRLSQGEVIGLPTETVYGLAADATDDRAVARIFDVKQRPTFNPLIVHVSDVEAAREIVDFSETALELAAAFWPGPLTLVLPRKTDSSVSLLASAGLDHLAVRAPDHDVVRDVLLAFGRPLAAPSANPSGRVSPTTAAHVADLPIDFVIDGGPCRVGIESTIVRVEADRVIILRSGAITADALEKVCDIEVCYEKPSSELPTAPGQLESHYAPGLPVRLNATTVAANDALLAFGPPLEGAGITLNLSPAGDLSEAAANLFAMLRRLDDPRYNTIAVMPVPETGLGTAINDRLGRAAAPRKQTR